MLLLILTGIIAYGGYFWRAHSLQQIANDAARAAIGGLTASERASIARDAVVSEIGGLAGLSAANAKIDVQEAGETITVNLAYDVSADPIFRLGLAPMPDPLIRRTAIVRLGGL